MRNLSLVIPHLSCALSSSNRLCAELSNVPLQYAAASQDSHGGDAEQNVDVSYGDDDHGDDCDMGGTFSGLDARRCAHVSHALDMAHSNIYMHVSLSPGKNH